MKTIKSASLLFLFIFPSPPLFGRWATLEDSPAISLFDNSSVNVHRDGSFSDQHESLLEIRNEEGRSNFGTSTFKYNPKTTTIRNLVAETRDPDGTVYPVPQQFIEDKPLASSSEGFDETHQVSIAYPHVTTGSRLYVRFTRETFKTALPNFYSDEYYFGLEYFEKSSRLEIGSELPLFIQVNDPHHHLTVEHESGKSSDYLKIELASPVYTKPLDEESDSLNHFAKTWVYVSTQKNPEIVGASVAPAYENILSAPLPPLFEKILAAAREKTSVPDQINQVTSMLAEQIRYMGDWREIQGGHIPRPLDLIASTRFGDCKDYAVSAAAIFRKLGIDAHVAWIERDTRPTPFPEIALDSAFNHAIIKVVANHRTYWVDPTNYSSYAQGIFDDLLDRPALVLRPHEAVLEKTPKGQPSDSSTRKELDVWFDSLGNADISARIDYLGRAATSLAGLSREMSREAFSHLLGKSIAGDNPVEEIDIQDYSLNSRITKDISLHATLKVRGLAIRTTAGNAYLVNRGILGSIIDLDAGTRVSDLPLDYPQTEHVIYRLKRVRLIGKQPHDCTITSPWLNASRHLKQIKQDFVVEDRVEIREPILPAKATSVPEFQQFQEQLERCFNQVALTFQPIRG